MKTKPALFLLALPLGATLSAQNAGPAAAPTTQTAPGNQVTPGSILAAQIQAIIDTKDLSEESKGRQIAAAIRLAMTTALKNVTDPQEASRVVLELTQAATVAAPKFGDLIFSTVTVTARDIPVLAAQPGLAENVRAVVADTVRETAAAAPAAGADANQGDSPKDAPPEFHGSKDDVIVSPSR
ncbi:MAG: hypothetical protein WDM96_09545 [Lacunisphaera sp.]